MKKKVKQSAAAADQRSSDYVVGQVSGSLFQKNPAASGSSLSALFSSAAPAAPLLFTPAPQPVRKSSEEKEQRKEAPDGKRPSQQEQKRTEKKERSEEALENRESGLQNADQDEREHQTAVRKSKKRKAPEPGGNIDVEQIVMKRQKMRARKEEEAAKSKRTAFVGNLPIGCTKKTLQTLFRETGTIESIRFRSVVRDDPSMSRKVAVIKRKVHPKKQSMNAYVVFKDEDGAMKALERNGMEIQKDFHIRVDRVTDSSSHDHKRSVFVGNLSFEMNESAFRRHFEECGSVEAVRLVRDPNSGLGKGFGYVLFETADSVQLALELDGSKLEGRSIRVKRSVKKEKVKKSDSKDRGPSKGPTKGPQKGSFRGPGRERGGIKSPKKFSGNKQKSSKSLGSFKGEMTDPNRKVTKKGQKKKKVRSKRAVHI